MSIGDEHTPTDRGRPVGDVTVDEYASPEVTMLAECLRCTDNVVDWFCKSCGHRQRALLKDLSCAKFETVGCVFCGHINSLTDIPGIENRELRGPRDEEM